MKPRHTAALALVGWYLMVPPMHLSSEAPCVTFDDGAPLNKWFVLGGSLDTAEECETAKQQATKMAEKQCEANAEGELVRLSGTKEKVAVILKTMHTTAKLLCDDLRPGGLRRGLCVADDDPRLKEK
jgi:hypothetical protein